MKPDAILEIRFNTTKEGGRQSDVVGDYYCCPLFVDGEAFDCRISLEGRTLRLGETYEVPVRFLSPAVVVPQLSPGTPIVLWEGKEVGRGKVVRIP